MNDHVAEPFRSICNNFCNVCKTGNAMAEDREENDWEKREKYLEEKMDDRGER